MKELSLHILDIAKNSVRAKAKKIEITINEDIKHDKLIITIADNGCGMEEEILKSVRDPFITTRTTRSVGLGIPLFEAAANQSGGGLWIESAVGKGTVITAEFVYSSIDRAPIGDISGTIVILISGSPEIRFVYNHLKNGEQFMFDTAEIKKQLGGIPITEPEILSWIGEYIEEGIKMQKNLPLKGKEEIGGEYENFRRIAGNSQQNL